MCFLVQSAVEMLLPTWSFEGPVDESQLRGEHVSMSCLMWGRSIMDKVWRDGVEKACLGGGCEVGGWKVTEVQEVVSG